ncbi:MAG: hypothetical protein AAGE03_03700 [Pseudomonadota bacterium]
MVALRGNWNNVDTDATGISQIEIADQGNGRAVILAHVSVAGGRQVLGKTVVHLREGAIVALFPSPAETVALTMRLQGHSLLVTEIVSRNDDPSANAAPRLHIFLREEDAPLPVVWMDLAPPVPTQSGALRSVTSVPDLTSYVRLYGLLTRPEHRTRLALDAEAEVGRRSVRQVFVGPKTKAQLVQKFDAKVFQIDKAASKALHDQVSQAILSGQLTRGGAEMRIEVPQAVVVPTLPERRRGAGSAEADPRASLFLNGGAALDRGVLHEVFRGGEVRAMDHTAIADRLAVIHNQMAVVNARPPVTLELQAQAAQAVIARDISRFVLVEGNGKPVLTRRRAPCPQVIAPAWVSPDLYADRLDAPEEMPGGIVLLRHEVQANGQRATVYQDALQPRQIQYEPEAFRLVRAETAPHAPRLLFHLSETAPQEDAEVETSVSVTMTYVAEPTISPILLDAMRAQFGADAALAPVMPTVSRLTVRLPADAENPAVEISRDGVEIDFADGLTDTIVFNEAEFRRLTTGFQTVGGVGLSGDVHGTFPDGRTMHVPLEIGLRDTLGTPVQTWFEPQGAAALTLALRNKIESPVEVGDLPVVVLPAGGTARPTGPQQPVPLAPGAIERVAYSVVGGPLGPAPAAPHVTDLTVLPDVPAILAQTTIVQGYDTDTFEIVVAVDPAFFGSPPAGLQALTGLEVRFRTRDEPVKLAPSAPSVHVTLPMPFLLFLTDAANAQHYTYSVRDLHVTGPGAESSWRAGSGRLDVEPAMVTAAFGAL